MFKKTMLVGGLFLGLAGTALLFQSCGSKNNPTSPAGSNPTNTPNSFTPTGSPTAVPGIFVDGSQLTHSNDKGVVMEDVNCNIAVNGQPLTTVSVVINSPAMSQPVTVPFSSFVTVAGAPYAYYNYQSPPQPSFNYVAGQPYTFTCSSGVLSASSNAIAPGNITHAVDGSQSSWTVNGLYQQIYVGSGSSSSNLYNLSGVTSPWSIPATVYNGGGVFSLSTFLLNTNLTLTGGTSWNGWRIQESLTTAITLATPTFTPTGTLTPSNTPTITDTPTITNTFTPTITRTPTNSPTNSPTATITNTATPSLTPTISNTATNSPTSTPTRTATNSPTVTPTPSPTKSPTVTPTNSPTKTSTNSPTNSATTTPTKSPTPTITSTPTNSPTNTPTATITNTPLSWHVVGSAGISSGAVSYVSMDNSSGTVNVGYVDGSTGRPTLATYNFPWTFMQMSTHSAWFADMVAPYSPSLYMTYSDNTNSNYPAVIYMDTNTLVTTALPSPPIPFTAGLHEQVYLDGTTPYLAFTDNSSNGWVMTYNGSSWTTVGSGPFSNNTNEWLSLYVNTTTHVPYVAFVDGNNSGYLSVMTVTGSIWSYVGNAGFSAGAPAAGYTDGLSFCGTNTGNLYAGLYNATNGYGQVWQSSGSTWSLLGGGNGFAQNARHPSVAVYNDTPYVGYEDQQSGNNGGPSVMVYSGGSWSYAGLPNFSNNGSSSPACLYPILSFLGNYLYMAFGDGNQGGKLSVYEYY